MANLRLIKFLNYLKPLDRHELKPQPEDKERKR